MTEITSKTLHNGYKVVVSYDTDPQSPREWDNFGTVVIHNRSRYAFADETADMHELLSLESDKNNIVLPIYLYDHSGITINTTGFSCPWDSGQVGVIYCTKADAVREFGNKVCTAKVRDKALKVLKAEIEELDQYIQGDVLVKSLTHREKSLIPAGATTATQITACRKVKALSSIALEVALCCL